MNFLRKLLRTKPNVEHLREQRDVNGLIEILQHENWQVRKTAIEALGSLGDNRAIKPLLEVLKQDVEVPEKLAKSLENFVGAIGNLGIGPTAEQQTELRSQQGELKHRRGVIEKALSQLGYNNERRQELVESLIKLINSGRQMAGKEALSDDELPNWKQILMNAPEDVLFMPVDGVHTHLDLESYVKKELSRWQGAGDRKGGIIQEA